MASTTSAPHTGDRAAVDDVPVIDPSNHASLAETNHQSTTTNMPSQTERDVANADGSVNGHADGNANAEGHVQHDEPAAMQDKPAAAANDAPQRSKLKILLIMMSLCIAVLLVALDITIVTTCLPTISAEFKSASGYTWVGSAYLIANSAATPIWGKVSDIFGRKPCLLVTNAIFFVGSLLAGVSVNMQMLIAARVVQGIGGGGLIVLVNIAISDLFSIRDRGAYFGMIGGVWALASSMGPVVGGAFTQNVTWRWCFYLNLPLDGLAFVIILLVLDLQTPKTPLLAGLKAVDWLGSLTMVGGTVMLLLGLEYGGVSHPWRSAIVVCLVVFGALLIGLFFVVEWRLAVSPLMPLQIFSKRSNLAALGCCFFHSVVFISSSYFLPLYFQAVRGATPILSGVYLLPTAVSLSITAIFTGIFVRKTGQYLPPIWFGFVLMALGYGLFIDLATHSPWSKIVVYQVVAGLGVGPNFQAPLLALQSGVAKRDIATATATFGFTRNLGSAISVVIGSVVFQNRMASHQPALRAALGSSQAAQAFSGGAATANVAMVAHLPSDAQREAVRDAFASSLSTMWIMYVVFAVCGLLVSGLVARNVLGREHEETKTGLDAERVRREEREMERVERRRKRSVAKGAEKGEGEGEGGEKV